MSRITLTKKKNGRYYLGMDEVDCKALKELLVKRKTANADAIIRITKALNKPARGEA